MLILKKLRQTCRRSCHNTKQGHHLACVHLHATATETCCLQRWRYHAAPPEDPPSQHLLKKQCPKRQTTLCTVGQSRRSSWVLSGAARVRRQKLQQPLQQGNNAKKMSASSAMTEVRAAFTGIRASRTLHRLDCSHQVYSVSNTWHWIFSIISPNTHLDQFNNRTIYHLLRSL
jgi:hypothetical protein